MRTSGPDLTQSGRPVAERCRASILILAILVVLAACGGSGNRATPVAAETTTTLDHDTPPPEAITACHTVVKTKLKAPSTASFDTAAPAYTGQIGGSGSYTIKGTVDSDSGSGVLVRLKYECLAQRSTFTSDSPEYTASLMSLK